MATPARKQWESTLRGGGKGIGAHASENFTKTEKGKLSAQLERSHGVAAGRKRPSKKKTAAPSRGTFGACQELGERKEGGRTDRVRGKATGTNRGRRPLNGPRERGAEGQARPPSEESLRGWPRKRGKGDKTQKTEEKCRSVRGGNVGRCVRNTPPPLLRGQRKETRNPPSTAEV